MDGATSVPWILIREMCKIALLPKHYKYNDIVNLSQKCFYGNFLSVFFVFVLDSCHSNQNDKNDNMVIVQGQAYCLFTAAARVRFLASCGRVVGNHWRSMVFLVFIVETT